MTQHCRCCGLAVSAGNGDGEHFFDNSPSAYRIGDKLNFFLASKISRLSSLIATLCITTSVSFSIFSALCPIKTFTPKSFQIICNFRHLAIRTAYFFALQKKHTSNNETPMPPIPIKIVCFVKDIHLLIISHMV